jgi:general secretion pathway protein G
MKSRSKSGFTLVEILIVVVILGILAAIVIPQFSEASTEARTSSVKSNLQMVRSQIELYKIQHADDLPGTAVAGVTFEDALLEKTDIDGDDTGTDDYGPYMQKFPINALNDSAVVTLDATVAGTLAACVVTEGWYYNSETGEFGALQDDAAVDSVNW